MSPGKIWLALGNGMLLWHLIELTNCLKLSSLPLLLPRKGYNTFTLVEKLSGDVTLLFKSASFWGAIISDQLSIWLASISCTGGVSLNCKHICTRKHTRSTTTAIISSIKLVFHAGKSHQQSARLLLSPWSSFNCPKNIIIAEQFK